MRICLFFVLIIFVHSQDTFQERVIYYSESDNVCQKGEKSDVIDLTIILDGKETIKATACGGTGCDAWVRPYWGRVIPAKAWGKALAGGNIYFIDETTYIEHFGVVIRIIQKSVVENPVVLNGKTYECHVIGTGKKEHFGEVPVVVYCDNKLQLQSE